MKILSESSIDVITLSSTHLLFLKTVIKKRIFQIYNLLIQEVLLHKKFYLKIKNKQSKRNSLKIFTSGDVKLFQTKLNKIGIKNKVNFLEF